MYTRTQVAVSLRELNLFGYPKSWDRKTRAGRGSWKVVPKDSREVYRKQRKRKIYSEKKTGDSTEFYESESNDEIETIQENRKRMKKRTTNRKKLQKSKRKRKRRSPSVSTCTITSISFCSTCSAEMDTD